MKPRSTSVDAAVTAAKNTARPPLKPPPHVRLRPGDEAFFCGVLAGRARDEWVPADLVVAAQLARAQADIEHEAAELDREGSIVNGKANPRSLIVDQLCKRSMALMRTLRMGGRAAGDARDEAGRRQLERQALAVRADLERERELLA